MDDSEEVAPMRELNGVEGTFDAEDGTSGAAWGTLGDTELALNPVSTGMVGRFAIVVASDAACEELGDVVGFDVPVRDGINGREC